MNPISSFMQRRRAESDAVGYYRADARARKKAGRIDASPRNRATDTSGRRLNLPTSYQIGAGTAKIPSFQQSRADRVMAAKRDGSFDGIRNKFNIEAARRGEIMDEDGTIRASNPYKDGGQIGGPQPAPPQERTLEVKPADQKTENKPLAAFPASNKGRIMDGDKDVTEDIQRGLAGDRTGGFYGSQAGRQDPLMKSSQAIQNAAREAKRMLPNAGPQMQAVPPAALPPNRPQTPAQPTTTPTAAAPQPVAPTPKPVMTQQPTTAPAVQPRPGTGQPRNQVARNPRGIVSRLPASNAPTPKALTDPIGTAGRGIAAAGSAVGGFMRRKAAANPEGLFAKLAGARADGGPVKKGKAYLVGERGPEIIVAKKDGHVIPNHKIKRKFLESRASY